MNKIIEKITAQNFLDLKSAFENSKDIFWDQENNKLIHPGEYGTYRERLLKKWLRMYIPKNFDISSGFIINSENKISSQCDIIIYNKDITPHIENSEKQSFYPIESVIAIGEVKSTINTPKDLNNALKKLSKLKKFRKIKDKHRVHKSVFNDEFNIEKNPFHNVFTFLICYKFNFDYRLDIVNYENIEHYYHHNVILSLTDGIANYATSKTGNLGFPFSGSEKHYQHFCKNKNSDLPPHIKIFLTTLNTAMFFTTQLEIDMAFYLDDDSVSIVE